MYRGYMTEYTEIITCAVAHWGRDFELPIKKLFSKRFLEIGSFSNNNNNNNNNN